MIIVEFDLETMSLALELRRGDRKLTSQVVNGEDPGDLDHEPFYRAARSIHDPTGKRTRREKQHQTNM